MTETRKIAAILVADVVGFSRMASADEDRTLARLRALRTDLIDPTIAGQNGRVFKRTGDGALVEFRSVVDAVRCAIAIQNAMIERNVGVPAERRIDFRIGIHLGDVVEESDGDLMGDGVNIAARLEGIAEPGAICLSEDAYRQVKGRLDLAVTDLGPTQLKNIAEPMRAYSLQVGVPAVAEARDAGEAARAEEAIHARAARRRDRRARRGRGRRLVFPRRKPPRRRRPPRRPRPRISPSSCCRSRTSRAIPSQDYFADGVTENLTTDLSRIRDSFVIARNTAFTFKGKTVDAKEIGKELGVRYVLEGSVQRDRTACASTRSSSTRESGAHLWADRFEEDVADLFKLQDQVVARLANALGYELVKAEAEAGARSKNPDAIDLDMRGWAAMCQWAQQPPTKDNIVAVRALFERALEIDPNDADALAGEADTYLVEYAYGWTNPETDYDAKILGQADRSIALARDNACAYSGEKLVFEHFASPERRASASPTPGSPSIRIPPISTRARAPPKRTCANSNKRNPMLQQAMRLSPRDPRIGQWHNFLADAELGLGHFDAAIDEANKAIDAGYRVFYSYLNLAAAHALKGDMDQAKTPLAEARRLNPKLSVKWLIGRKPILQPAFDALRKAGLPEE